MSGQGSTTCNYRRILREAEGLLELATLFDDQFGLDQDQRSSLADLCLKTLEQIPSRGRGRLRVLYLGGQAHRLAGRYRQAIRDLQAAWELDSNNIHTCLALGWCHKRLGQMEQAVRALQSGLTVDSRCGILHFNLACYMSLGGQLKMALMHLARAIEIDDAFRALAASEKDFDAIRNDPGFRELAPAVV